MRSLPAILAAASLILASSCSRGNSGLAVRVGSRTVSLRELRLRMEEQKLENPGMSIEEPAVLGQLLRAYAYAEILGAYGRPVTRETLQTEADRIERETLMPDRLHQLRSVFVSNEDFLNLYALPVYVNRVLYFDFFLKERRFHWRPFGELERLRSAATLSSAVPSSGTARVLRSFASAHGGSYAEGIYTVDGLQASGPRLPHGLGLPSRDRPAGEVPAGVSRAAFGSPGADSTPRRLIDEVLGRMRAGELTPVLEWQTQLSLMRLVRKTGPGSFRVQSVTLEKANFEDWVAEEGRKLKIQCGVPSECPALLSRLRGARD